MENRSVVTVMLATASSPNRFEERRTEAAARATLEQAALVAEMANQRVGRAMKLLATAVSMDPAARASATLEARAALAQARTDLDDIIRELKT